MTNQESLGISKLDLMKYINPSFSINNFIIEDIESGDSGEGGAGIYIVSGANWRKNQWAKWELKIDDNYYEIQGNSSNELELEEDLSEAGASWSITKREFDLSSKDFEALLKEAVQCVLGDIPEKYRKMIYEINGEIIVEKASANQDKATLSFPAISDDSIQIFKNPENWQERDLAEALKLGTDYSIENKQIIKFINPLYINSKIVAYYQHNLPIIPSILKILGIYKMIILLTPWAYNMLDKDLINIMKIKEEYNDIIKNLKDGAIGISEFDKIKLWDETRAERSGGIFRAIEVL